VCVVDFSSTFQEEMKKQEEASAAREAAYKQKTADDLERQVSMHVSFIYVSICTPIYVYKYMHIYICIYIYTNAYIYTYTNTHISRSKRPIN